MAVKPPTQMPASTAFSLTPLGKYAGKPPLVLNKAVVLIGSDERCHLRIVSSSVSRRHAMIVHGDDGIYIRDLASRTKVLINGQEQHEADLADGDEIQIGKYSFKFSTPEEPMGLSLPAAPAQVLINGKPISDSIKGRVLLIGRTPDCDIPFDDEAVSSRHAVIFEANGKRFLRDLDSRTGTFRNGKKIHQHEIKPGDSLRIGKATLSVAILAELPEAAETPIGFEPAPVEIESPLAPEIPVADIQVEPAPVEIEPEPEQKIEAPQPPAIPQVDLAAEPAPVELEPEPAPTAEAIETPDLPPLPVIDLSDEDVLRELEPETAPKSEAAEPATIPIELEPEPMPEAQVAETPAPLPLPEINLSDEDVLRELEPEATSKIEAVEPIPEIEAVETLPAPSIPEAGVSDAEVLHRLEPEASKIEAAEPPIANIEPEPAPIPEPEAIETFSPSPLPEIGLSDDPAVHELEPQAESKIEAAEPPIANIEPEPALIPEPVAIETFSPPPLPEIDLSDDRAEPAIESIEPSPVHAEPEPVPEIEAIEPLAVPPIPELAAAPHIEALEPIPSVEIEPEVPREIEAIVPLIAPPMPLSEEEIMRDLQPEPAIESNDLLIPPPLPEVDFSAELASLDIDLESAPKIEAAEPAIPPSLHEPAPTMEAMVQPPLPEIEFAPKAAQPEPEVEPEPATAAIEPLAPPPLPELDLTAEPASMEREPESEPKMEAIEPLISPPLSEADFSGKVTPVETESAPVAAAGSKAVVADSPPAPEIDLNPPEMTVELTPAPFESAPIDVVSPPAEPIQATTNTAAVEPSPEIASPADDSNSTAPAEGLALDAAASPIADDLTAQPPKKSRVGRPRRQPTEIPAPKAPRKRIKRTPPKSADELVPEPIQLSTPPDVESGLEIRADDFSATTPEISPAPINEIPLPEQTESAPAIEEPVAPFEFTAPMPIDEPSVAPAAEAPSEFSISDPETQPAIAASLPEPAIPELVEEPPQAAPAPVVTATTAPMPEPEAPLSSMGGMVFFGGGTVNLDHFLGGMPIQLQDLPQNPQGFGKVKYDLEGKSSPPPKVSPFAAAETIVTPPLPPAPSAPPVAKAAPPPPRKPTTFATGPHKISADEFPPAKIPDLPRRPIRARAKPSEKSSAFDGLAMPTVRETDVFSDHQPLPVNDAPFGGANQSQVDDFILPETPERAARLAGAPEHDFAEDDFWNRTDEEDGLPPMSVPQPPSAAAPVAENVSPPIPRAVKPIPHQPEPIHEIPEPIVAEEPAQDLIPPIPIEPVASNDLEDIALPIDELMDAARIEDIVPAEDTTPTIEDTVLGKDAAPAEDIVPTADISPIEDIPPAKDIASTEEAIPMADDTALGEDSVPVEDIAPAAGEHPIEAIAPVENIAPTEEAAPTADDTILSEDAVPVEDIVPTADDTALGEDAAPIEDIGPASQEHPTEEIVSTAENIALVENSAPLEDAAIASAPINIVAPRPRPRRRFRIPFLMPLILLAIGASLFAIWRFIPVQSQIDGKITFQNYNWTPGTQDATEFEAAQRRLLDSDQTQENAVDILRRQHPDIAAGFLKVPDLLSRAISSLVITASHDTAGPQADLQLSYTGGDKAGDRARMLALFQSLIDSNAPVLDKNRRLRDAAQQAQAAVEDTRQKLDQTRSQLTNLQLALDDPQPAGDLKTLIDRKAQLQKDRTDAEQAVNSDQATLAALQSPPGSPQEANAVASTTQPDAADPSLAQMRQQLADLTAEMQSARSDQVSGAILARQQLESAAKEFNDQLSAANTVLGSGSQLRQFVDSAKDSQAKAHDLINMLIIDGEDLEKQLDDTRRAVEDMIQARQEQKWADDPQLQQLRANLDSAQHRYNANVGDGIKDPRILDPLQKEVDNWTSQVKARQAQLGIDPSEIRVQEGLTSLIQSLRNKLDKQKQEIDMVLNPLEKQLNDLDPVIAALPEAQQDLARQIHVKLDALNAARWKYSLAIGEGQVAPSPKVTELQKQIDDLKARLDSRQADLVQQLNKAHEAQRTRDIKSTQSKLDIDQKKLDAAKKASDEIAPTVDAAQTRHAAAQAAQLKKISLMDDQHTLFTALEAAQHDRDEKQTVAERAFDIKPLTDSDVVATSPGDPRMMYSLLVMGAGMLLFAALTYITHSASANASVPEHDDPHTPPSGGHPPEEHLSDDDEEPLPV